MIGRPELFGAAVATAALARTLRGDIAKPALQGFGVRHFVKSA